MFSGHGILHSQGNHKFLVKVRELFSVPQDLNLFFSRARICRSKIIYTVFMKSIDQFAAFKPVNSPFNFMVTDLWSGKS